MSLRSTLLTMLTRSIFDISVVFLRLEGRDSYDWGLVLLCLGVRDSYV